MAYLSSKVKAYLISKGKTELEVKELLGSQTSIILEADSSGESIKAWDVTGITKPTDSELTAANTEAEKLEELHKIRKKRRSEYPSLKEQFDLLYKDLVAGKVDATGEWAKTIKKVKDDNPKS
mgnify:CR=1 FL=1